MINRQSIEDALDSTLRWAKLRWFGNSHLAQATMLVPVLGYFLLFNAHILDYLRIHTDFCSRPTCEISWRLYFIYFGCFFIAIGAAVYKLRCPAVIKLYTGAPNYFDAEVTYFSAPQNLKYLFNIIKADKKDDADDPSNLRQYIATNAAVPDKQRHALTDLMGEYYILQNKSRRNSRIFALGAYSIGIMFMMVPTIGTFVQIAKRAILALWTTT